MFTWKQFIYIITNKDWVENGLEFVIYDAML